MSDTVELPTYCHRCRRKLRLDGRYPAETTRMCDIHGHYFIYQVTGKEPILVFRSFGATKFVRIEKRPRPPEKPVPTGKKKWEFRPYRMVPEDRPIVVPPEVALRCDQTGDIFPSVRQAAKLLGLDKSCVHAHIAGRHKAVKGYTFTVLDLNDPTALESKPLMPMVNKGMRVKCNETGEVFDTIAKAAKVLNISRTSISIHLNNRPRCSHVGGYTFTRVED